MTDKNPEELEEHRFKFNCTFGELDRIETRIRSECFVRGMLLDNFNGMSGLTALKDRTYGVRVRGTKKQITDFKKWWEEHEEDLCDTRTVLGAFIRDHL
jgi:hypothetical protein